MDELTRERYPHGVPWAEGPGDPPYIVCAGRDHDDRGNPIGDPCGAKVAATALVSATDRARAADWSTAGPPMCPSCRRTDPRIAAALRDRRPL